MDVNADNLKELIEGPNKKSAKRNTASDKYTPVRASSRRKTAVDGIFTLPYCSFIFLAEDLDPVKPQVEPVEGRNSEESIFKPSENPVEVTVVQEPAIATMEEGVKPIEEQAEGTIVEPSQVNEVVESNILLLPTKKRTTKKSIGACKSVLSTSSSCVSSRRKTQNNGIYF